MSEQPDLEPPAVPADEYTEEYYTTSCAGHEGWSEGRGATLGGYYVGMLTKASFGPGQVLVDIGMGRGELVCAAAEAGASRSVGIEYSKSALALAHETAQARGVSDKVELLLADARRVPVDDGTADLVTLLDVVEHLTPAELDGALKEALRILRPGGTVFIHTLPNRYIYDLTYRMQRAVLPWRLAKWPAQPRRPLELVMHVNEQTRRGLRASVAAAGFTDARCDYGDWIHDDFVPSPRARKLYRRLAGIRPTRFLGAGDLWAKGHRPPAA